MTWTTFFRPRVLSSASEARTPARSSRAAGPAAQGPWGRIWGENRAPYSPRRPPREESSRWKVSEQTHTLPDPRLQQPPLGIAADPQPAPHGGRASRGRRRRHPPTPLVGKPPTPSPTSPTPSRVRGDHQRWVTHVLPPHTEHPRPTGTPRAPRPVPALNSGSPAQLQPG